MKKNLFIQILKLTFSELTRISLNSSWIRAIRFGIALALRHLYLPGVVIAILIKNNGHDD
jgi:hypothetical protein